MKEPYEFAVINKIISLGCIPERFRSVELCEIAVIDDKRTYYFEDYNKMQVFVAKVMQISNKQNHHPDILVHRDNVKLSVTDKKKGMVSDKCHKLAKSIDNIY